jgi:type I restriction enzyme S subunit
MHVGTLIPHFKKGDFDKLLLPIPPRSEQVAIGDLYFDISARIDLLARTNSTLESIAQALFKSWFIDFDPVRAKAEGREPEGMDAATAALFPDEFEKSALGLIPKGWKVGSVGDIAEVIDCLHSKKPTLQLEGKPYLQLNNIRDDGLLDVSSLAFISESDYVKWTARIEVREGDCVITNVGRVGAVSQVPPGLAAAMGRNMTAIRLRPAYSYPSVLIELLLSPSMRSEIDRRTDIGTILNALNVRSIPLLQFVLASHPVLRCAESVLRPIRAAMESNIDRASNLARIRDALLPRLIAGKLRLPEAVAVLEAA